MIRGTAKLLFFGVIQRAQMLSPLAFMILNSSTFFLLILSNSAGLKSRKMQCRRSRSAAQQLPHGPLDAETTHSCVEDGFTECDDSDFGHQLVVASFWRLHKNEVNKKHLIQTISVSTQETLPSMKKAKHVNHISLDPVVPGQYFTLHKDIQIIDPICSLCN